MNKTVVYAYTGVVITMLFWGSAFNAMSYIIQSMPPLSAAAERFTLASLALFIIFAAMGKLRWATFQQNLFIYLIIGIIGIAGFNIGCFYGLQTTSAVNGALIMATTPLITLMLAILLDGEKLTLPKFIGVVFGLSGVLFVISHGHISTLLHLKIAIGDFYILLGGISFCLANVLSRRYVKNATPLETTTLSMLFGALTLIILSLIFEHPFKAIVMAPITAHLAMGYVIICSTMIAYLFWFNGIQKLGAGRASIFFNFVPVFSMLVAMLAGQTLNIWQIIGTALVMLGVLSSSGFIQIKRRPALITKPCTK
ncbi:DMT family transporter [Acinetobacter nosocomialis]|uniref:DMT family transporter n=1 Tax=Acinetobacter nosocomialis TaxID=106654 RepID=UPI001ADBFD60|nr:DMT family transporter [Acinetobacter nosocomialis]